MGQQDGDRACVRLGRVLGLVIEQAQVAELHERVGRIRTLEAAGGDPHHEGAGGEVQRLG